MSGDSLLQAAAAVDVIDAAGRIIANPRRNAIQASAAEVLALACATERFWAVCIEADLLWRALERAMPWDRPADGEHLEHVAGQMAAVRDLMAALRGEPNTTEGDDHADRDH